MKMIKCNHITSVALFVFPPKCAWIYLPNLPKNKWRANISTGTCSKQVLVGVTEVSLWLGQKMGLPEDQPKKDNESWALSASSDRDFHCSGLKQLPSVLRLCPAHNVPFSFFAGGFVSGRRAHYVINYTPCCAAYGQKVAVRLKPQT